MKSGKKFAVCIIEDEEDRILLQFRDRINIYNSGGWGPFGGQINQNETSEMGITREINEELSINLEDFEFLFKNKHPEGEVYVFKSEIKKNQIKNISLSEGRGFGLFYRDEIPHLKIGDDHKIIIERYLKDDN